ncbi:MAG TPA: PH domain-containing protein [Streptosporangiaceae bacterium]
MTDEHDLSAGEQTVLTLHPHWKTVLRPMLILAAAAVAASVVLTVIPAGQLATPIRAGVALVAVIVALVWTLVPLLRWRTTTYQLTTRRLRLRYGILSRTGRDFPLLRISDVSFSHGLIDRLLGCGKLVVESAGEHGQLVLTEIPHVQKVQATLFQLVEDEQAGLARDDR